MPDVCRLLGVVFLTAASVAVARGDASVAVQPGAPLEPSTALVVALANGSLPLSSVTRPGRGILHVAHFSDDEMGHEDPPAQIRYTHLLCSDEERHVVLGTVGEIPGHAAIASCRATGGGWVCSGAFGSPDNGDLVLTTLYFIRDTDGRLLLDAMVHTNSVPYDRKTRRAVEKQLKHDRTCRR